MERQSGGASIARANAVAQIALGMSQDRSDPSRPYRDVCVSVGTVDDGAFQRRLSFATGTPDLAFAVARGEIDLAAINPSAYLTMAHRGTGPFPEPLPLRTVAVMPSWDRMAFAVSERTGISSIAELRDRKYPLRVSIRASLAHGTRFVIDQVLDAAGFALADIESWGGTLHFVSSPSEASRLEGMRDGTIEAVFDEGIKSWGPLALQSGMRFLPLDPPALQRLEGLGWRCGPLTASRFPTAPGDLLLPSFSGWPLFTRAALADEAAYGMARALDAARSGIAFDADGPVALSDLCQNNDATDLDVPLHPGAQRYYAECGALG